MAKRRKRHHHSRRRRVGAMSLNASSPLVKLGSIALGYLVGDVVNTPLDKIIPEKMATATGVKKYIPAAVEGGLGILLMKAKRGNVLLTAGGGFLVGAAIKRALKAAGTISGYQSVPVIGRNPRFAGYQSTPVIGGVPPQLSGVPPQLSGYRVNGVGAYSPNGSGAVMGAVDTVQRNTGSGYMG